MAAGGPSQAKLLLQPFAKAIRHVMAPALSLVWRRQREGDTGTCGAAGGVLWCGSCGASLSPAMHRVLAPFQQGPWWRGQGAGSVSGTSREPSSRRCVARHRPAAGQVHCLRRLWQELVLEKTSRAGSVGPVPRCGYAVPR